MIIKNSKMPQFFKNFIIRLKGLNTRISKSWFKGFQVTLAILFLVVLTFYIGWTSTAFSGFPKGYDAFGHLSLAKIISENFPNIFWNPYWDGGVVLFPRNYPPLYHFLLGLTARIFSLEVLKVANFFSAVNISLTAIFIFLTVWFLTKRVTIGLFSSFFLLASSTLWYQVLVNGLYPRIFAMMIFSLALFVQAIYFSETGKNKTWLYYLVIFSLILAFLTHFLAIFLASASFFIFLFSRQESFAKKIYQTIKIFLPVFGLTAFYLLPVLTLRFGSLGFLGSFGGKEYEPMKFLSLWKQSYPGLPSLSLPLGFLVFLLVVLLRDKIGKQRMKIFFGFGILSLFFLLYVVGGYGFLFSGVYPDHFLLPAAFTLSIFLGLGLSFLNSLKVVKPSLLLFLLIGLLTISLVQTPKLKKIAVDQSRIYPKIAFKGEDKTRLFRFSHQYDLLGGAFNFYSEGLQTRGYYGQGVLHQDFNWLFEEGVFKNPDNLAETKFLLDWFAVKNLYFEMRSTSERAVSVKIVENLTKDQDFAQVEGNEFQYKKAKPIILATNAPVILTKKRGKEYFDFIASLAKEGIDSQVLIPIRQGADQSESNFNTQVVNSPEEAEFVKEEDHEYQTPRFVNSQKREIELRKKFGGVLLKESYHPNWRAYLMGITNHESGIRKLPIYFAGPGMMYTVLPKDFNLPAKVVFEYQPGWVEKGGLGVSVATLVVLIFGGRLSRGAVKRLSSHLKGGLGSHLLYRMVEKHESRMMNNE